MTGHFSRMWLSKPQLLTLLLLLDLAIASYEDAEHLQTESSGLLLVGSALAAASAALIPLRSCIFSGKCREKLDEYRKQFLQDDLIGSSNSRQRRDMDYIEPVLAAILDTFVENEMAAARHNDDINNEVYSRSQPEPTLVTLAKYFDKYADKDVKKHVKVLFDNGERESEVSIWYTDQLDHDD